MTLFTRDIPSLEVIMSEQSGWNHIYCSKQHMGSERPFRQIEKDILNTPNLDWDESSRERALAGNGWRKIITLHTLKPTTPLPLQDRKAVNEHGCPGNGVLCNQEAWLFLVLEGEKKKKMTHYPFPPFFLFLSLPHVSRSWAISLRDFRRRETGLNQTP